MRHAQRPGLPVQRRPVQAQDLAPAQAVGESQDDRGLEPVPGCGVQELPSPGSLNLGSELELELHPAVGHTGDGVAIFIPGPAVLVVGDYLSPVEIPMISPGGSLAAYQATLDRLEPLIARAQWVVPGHGAPLPGEQASQILAEDRAYLAALAAGRSASELPKGRGGARQREIDAENVSRLD